MITADRIFHQRFGNMLERAHACSILLSSSVQPPEHVLVDIAAGISTGRRTRWRVLIHKRSQAHRAISSLLRRVGAIASWRASPVALVVISNIWGVVVLSLGRGASLDRRRRRASARIGIAVWVRRGQARAMVFLVQSSPAIRVVGRRGVVTTSR